MPNRYNNKEKALSFLINIFTLGFGFYGSRSTHAAMNAEHGGSDTICYACLDCFKEHFDNEKDLRTNYNHKKSLFTADRSRVYLHADIIRFNGVCFTMSTYGFNMAQRMIRKKIKEIGFTNAIGRKIIIDCPEVKPVQS